MPKTKRLYHFVNDQFGLENVARRRLKVSFADRVNDLFELRPFDFGKGEPGRKLRWAWGECIKKHAMEQGFISFSDSWEVPTMWAHYADNHKGVCLGFDVPMFRADDAKLVYKIDYPRKLEQMDSRVLTDFNYNKGKIETAKRTKSHHWQYEQEWRCWFSLDDEETKQKHNDPETLFYADFDDNLVLKEVIFGVRSRLTTEKFRSVLEPQEDLKFTTARPSFRDFKMVKQELKKLQK